ncbi:MAG: Crp/Fnr family transcriptional regulator [Bacteroidia bacterium]|nr:Crp/Fnr family transcriptional regulator [Bacteroidia bacterium]
MRENTANPCNLCTQKHTSVFCNAREENLPEIDDYKKCGIYKKGQRLFQESQPAFGVFCISQGKVKVVKSGEDGKEQILRFAMEGDMLGYRAILGDEHFSVSAIAMEDTKVCYIPREQFYNVIDHDGAVTKEVMKRLSDELKKAQDKITVLSQKSVRERTAETLLFLKGVFGCESDKETINVLLTREELGNLIGTATETTIRILSEFKNEGLIELNGKKIRLLKIDGLLKIASIQD